MNQNPLKIIILLCLLLVYNTTQAQLAKCKGKYLGNIISGSVPSNYNTYWNQATSENGSKWGSVEGTQGVYNFTNSDLAYNWAKNNNGLFKYHNFIWGGQTPGWVNTASTATITAAIEPYISAVAAHYNPMGGLKLIDVLNEPINTALPGNLKAALTAGYQSEPANAGDLNNQYGWAIWCFQLARKYFPNTTLLVNEYNIEMNWNNCRTPYIALVQAVSNAPNLTDGKKNLIDGVGLQCHGINALTAANFQACIDQIWNSTGVPVHITEFDQQASPNEATQQSVYSTLIPVAWAHPHVAGITLWGYIQGSTWIPGNGVLGPTGTDTGILYSGSYTSNPYGERPAMTWLKQYMASQPSLSCCPAPGPFASCSTTNSPTVSISSPATNTSFTAGTTITLMATASETGGAISKVNFYNGTTLLGGATASPYSYSWTNVSPGTYTITAIATDNSGNTATSTAITITVAPTATITAGGATTFCSGNNVILTANSGTGYTYQWNKAGTAISGATAASYTASSSGSYTVIVTAGGVSTTSTATAVTVNALPVSPTVTGAVAYCLGSAATALSATGTALKWYTVATGGTGVTTAPIPNTATAGTTDYYVSQTITGCESPRAAIAVTVNALPVITPYVQLNGNWLQQNTATVCAGATISIGPQPVATTGWTWTGPSNYTSTARQITLTNLTTMQGGVYTSNYTDANGCKASSAFTVTVNALPNVPTVVSPITYCQNATATALSATGTNLNWYTTATGGTASTTAPTPNTATAGTASYYVSQTTTGCEGTRAAIAVTVNALPNVPTVVSPVTYCQNATATALSATGTNLNWYTTATGGTASTVAPTPSTATAGTMNYYVSQTTNGCEGTRAAIAVTVNALPNIPTVVSPVTYCQNATATALSATGTNLNWYTTATEGTASTTAPTPNTATAGATSYYVSQTTNGCEGSRAAVVVTVNATPAKPTVTSPVTYCQNATATALSATGTNLNWYTTATGGTASTTAPIPSTATAGTMNYYVSQTTNGCEGARATITVTVNVAPSAPIVNSPVLYCQNASSVDLSATGSSLLWYTTSTGGTGIPTAPAPNTSTAGTTNYYVSQTINSCESARAVLAVIINPLPGPVITSASNMPICTGTSAVLTTSTASSYSWSNGTSQVGTGQTYTATAAGSYTVTVNNGSGCSGASAAFVVSISTQNCYDCANVLNGTATIDNCGVCTGGTTGLTACTTTGTIGSIIGTSILVYPQPFENTTKVELKNGGNIESITIYSSTGALVYTNASINSNEVEIGENLADGLYNVIIQTQTGSYTTKIVKVK